MVWVKPETRLLICGQAPGRRVHESGLPFDDPSGNRLRDWLGVDRDTFYGDPRIGVAAMAFCFPGTNSKGGDYPPPPRCAALWRRPLLARLPAVELTLLVGVYAQRWALQGAAKASMTATVAAWHEYGAAIIPMPHPSWRTTSWLRRNAWFLTASATTSNIQFKSATGNGGEVGAKGTFMGGRLGLDATAYLYDYENLQLTSFDATTFTYITKNAASARVEGVEIQGRYTVGGGLSTHGFVSYNHARFLNFANAQCYAGQTAPLGCVGGVQNLTGQPMGASPESSVNLGLTYDRPVGGGWSAALSADGYYYGRYNFSAGGYNFRPNSIQDPYGKLNMSLRAYRNNLEFAVIAENLTDTKWVISSADVPGLTPGSIYGQLGRPREVVLQANYRF